MQEWTPSRVCAWAIGRRTSGRRHPPWPPAHSCRGLPFQTQIFPLSQGSWEQASDRRAEPQPGGVRCWGGPEPVGVSCILPADCELRACRPPMAPRVRSPLRCPGCIPSWQPLATLQELGGERWVVGSLSIRVTHS